MSFPAQIQSSLDMLSEFSSDPLLRFVQNILTGSSLILRDVNPEDPILVFHQISSSLDGIHNICNIFVLFRNKHIWRLISHRMRLECAATVDTYLTHVLDVARSLNIHSGEACSLFRVPVDHSSTNYNQSSEYSTPTTPRRASPFSKCSLNEWRYSRQSRVMRRT